MIIVDTSIWIEFLKKKSPTFEIVEQLLVERSVLAVELVFAELLQGAKNERERQILLAYWNNLPKISSEDVLIRAGLTAGKMNFISKGIGLIDAVLIQIVKENAYQIWSLDKKLVSVLDEHERFVA